MNVFIRLTLCAGVLTLAWTCIRLTAGGGSAAQDPSFRLTLLHDSVDSDGEAEERLEARFLAVQRRIEAKRQLVEELLKGERNLLETAARFQALDRSAQDYNWDAFRMYYSGESDDERHCREVIARVETELWNDRCLTASVLSRLREELENYLAWGPITLPPL